MINFPTSIPAKSGSIPGLFIFDDFVTKEEEQVIVKTLDAKDGPQKWQKLLNRRVQHFGYEFKYGTNNVDPDQSLGEMPEFLHFLRPRLEKIMTHFGVTDGKNLSGDHDVKRVEFKKNPALTTFFLALGTLTR